MLDFVAVQKVEAAAVIRSQVIEYLIAFGCTVLQTVHCNS